MYAEDNRAIVGRFWQEVFNEGNLDVADKLFASDHVFHHPALPDEARGADVMKATVALFRMISPDLHLTVEDEVAEGDKVVTRWTASGTVADEMKGSGDEVTVSGISIFRISGGEIRDTWQRFDPHDDYPRPVPKEEQVRERLREDRLFRLLGEKAAFSFKCLFRPRTCRWHQPDLPE